MYERVNSIFIGVMTKQYARENDITETSEYKKFLKEVRAVVPLNAESTCKHQCQS